MKPLFAPFVADISPVSVIGLCKNAGKTTAMRRLMAELEGEVLGLTSVGRDGEATDLVTGTEKPDLYIKSGDLYATATAMLPLCDTTNSVEAVTDVMTPLGPVAVLRALSDGYIQLAGPSSASQLGPLAEQFYALGAQRVIIDGAAGRKSLASAGAEGCAILCTGASLERDMDWVVAETAHVCRNFEASRPEHPGLCAALDAVQARFALFTPEGEELPLPLDESGGPQWGKLPRTPCVLWVQGGVTDPLVKTLARRGAPLTLVTADPTHVLCSRVAMEAFRRSGNTLAVRHEIRIAAVSANPWSAYGWHYDGAKFLSALRGVLTLPIINVREEILA